MQKIHPNKNHLINQNYHIHQNQIIKKNSKKNSKKNHNLLSNPKKKMSNKIIYPHLF